MQEADLFLINLQAHYLDIFQIYFFDVKQR